MFIVQNPGRLCESQNLLRETSYLPLLLNRNGVPTSIHRQQIGVRSQWCFLHHHTADSCYFESHAHLSMLHTHRGLILHRPLGPSAPKINTNDWLRIGSTFHSLHAIAAEASPVKLPGNKNSGEKSLNTGAVLVFLQITI